MKSFFVVLVLAFVTEVTEGTVYERDATVENEAVSYTLLDEALGNVFHDVTEPVFCVLPNPDSLSRIKPRTIAFAPGKDSYAVVNDAERASRTIEIIAESGSYRRIVFIVHGFVESSFAPWMHRMKDAILAEEPDQIVVLVGWHRGSTAARLPHQIYRAAAANVAVVGKYLADIARRLKKSATTTNLQIYGIGHSLGSHVMGNAGRYSEGAFDRITGLDPAGPCFEKQNLDLRLSSSDAKMVDTIHTDGYPKSHALRPVNPIHYGTLIPLGHLDFYPNWGQRSQPGCDDIAWPCSHLLAFDLFTWGVKNPGKFQTKKRITSPIAVQHIDKTEPDDIYGPPAEMGYYADKPGRTKEGNFYIETRKNEPYV